MSKSRVPKQLHDWGFTMLEVLVALVILMVALMSMALLAARMLNGARGSHSMSIATTLASEKLEDLNRWNASDPQVCVPAGSTSVGSLTSDTPDDHLPLRRLRQCRLL